MPGAPLFMAARDGKLFATTLEDQAAVDRLPPGRTLRVTVRQDRSSPRHRLYWQLVRFLSEALTDMGAAWASPEAVDARLRVEGGVCQIFPCGPASQARAQGANVIAVPGSLSFAAMGDSEHARFVDAVSKAVLEELLPRLPADHPSVQRVEDLLTGLREAKARGGE